MAMHGPERVSGRPPLPDAVYDAMRALTGEGQVHLLQGLVAQGGVFFEDEYGTLIGLDSNSVLETRGDFEAGRFIVNFKNASGANKRRAVPLKDVEGYLYFGSNAMQAQALKPRTVSERKLRLARTFITSGAHPEPLDKLAKAGLLYTRLEEQRVPLLSVDELPLDENGNAHVVRVSVKGQDGRKQSVDLPISSLKGDLILDDYIDRRLSSELEVAVSAFLHNPKGPALAQLARDGVLWVRRNDGSLSKVLNVGNQHKSIIGGTAAGFIIDDNGQLKPKDVYLKDLFTALCVIPNYEEMAEARGTDLIRGAIGAALAKTRKRGDS